VNDGPKSADGYTPGGLVVLDDARIFGGGQRFALRLACAADDAGLDAAVASPAGSELAAACSAAGVRTLEAPFPGPHAADLPRLPGASLRLRRVLGGIDRHTVVVANSARCGVLGVTALALRRGAPPLVHLMHEHDSAARRSLGAFYRRQKGVVALGANAAAEYAHVLGGERVETIVNFLAPAELEALAAARAAPRDRRVLGVVARMHPAKGLPELAGELAAVPGAWDRLLVAAPSEDAEYERALKARIRDLGLEDRVELLGAVEDVPGFLASVGVLVVPSTGREAQPTVILEGLAAGLPVIVRRPVWSRDYERLPVVPYDGAVELGSRLAALPGAAADAAEVARRFGPEQALRGIARAAAR
jgi:glycosyltransferase involved in cell wall biosynthesis